jgi:hypothetical protein
MSEFFTSGSLASINSFDLQEIIRLARDLHQIPVPGRTASCQPIVLASGGARQQKGRLSQHESVEPG